MSRRAKCGAWPLSGVVAALLLVHAATVPSIAGDGYDPTTLVFPSFLHTMGIRKATKTHLMIYTRNRVKVRDPQGLAVARLDSWDDPATKKDDDQVTGYGVNSGENVIVYNKSMTSLGFYGKREKGIRKLNRPTAITANRRGDVYVADTGNDRVVRLFNQGKQLEFVRALGGHGALAGQFDAPRGITMDSNGHVYVSDTGNHRIQVLLPNDKLHHWFGKQGVQPGQLWHPTGIAVTNGKERWSHFKDAFVGVIDLDGKRVQKFSLDGRFVSAANMDSLGIKNAELGYLALDYYSNIWVTDRRNNCLYKFDRDLNFLCTFGRAGNGDKEFNEPRGIAIYKRFGQVFIAEKESAQYYWIGTDVLRLQSTYRKAQHAFVLNFFLTEPSFIGLVVMDPKDERHAIFRRRKYFSGGQTVVIPDNWRLGDRPGGASSEAAAGVVPAGGVYVFRLKAEATYSSLNYFVKEVETSVTIE